MLMTMKVSSLSYGIHDGMCRKHEDLSADQKTQAIKFVLTFS